MVGKVLELHNIITPDTLATRVTETYVQWDTLRRPKKNDWEEIKRYIYATDTTYTTNAQLPWKNKTTVPKLCQILDNLVANYISTLFPPNQRKAIIWEANDRDSASVDKANAIMNYMLWVVSQPWFKQEVYKLIYDYCQYGNVIGTVEWIDSRVQQPDKTQVGYIGPSIRRVSPLDIVFNPTAENFQSSPKIVRSIISMGELKKLLGRLTNDENQKAYEELFNYLKNIRFHARTFQGDWIQQDHMYSVDGFTSFRAYLMQDFVEVLTFYGDWYDYINDTFEENRVITVVDRHKLIDNKPNPSYFGYPPIFHSAWRKKQDNLWGMGPLDNLVGMQYRLDHVENMKSDVFDLVTYPVQKVKGFVEEFTWQPGEKIFIGDEGDVEMLVPDINALQANMEIQRIEQTMEEMAGSPREAMGIRSPGEKTKYEVQRLENAWSRLYQNKINQFSEEILEPLLNAMLELARRNLTGSTTIKVFDNDFNVATFQDLSVEDITGVGRIRAVAARHFSEQADLIQNLTQLTGSNLWQTVQPHFSGIKLAQLTSNIFGLDDLEIFSPYVAMSEQAEGQKQMQTLEEQVHKHSQTATGIGHDYDMDSTGMPSVGAGNVGGMGQAPQNR